MIRTLSSRIFLAGVASTSLLAVACSDDAEFDAKYSTLSEAQLRNAVELIQLGDVGQLMTIGIFVSGANEPANCPSFVTSGNVTTVAGGCTDADGDRFDGKIVITNMQGFFVETPNFDPTKPSTVEATGFKVTNAATPDSPAGTDTLDGKVTMTPSADGSATFVSEVDMTLDGVTSHSERSFTCDATDLCTEAEGNWLEISGVGSASLSGTYRRDEPVTGTLTAQGAETLVIDVAAQTDECATIRIEGGAARQVCSIDEGGSTRQARLAPVYEANASLAQAMTVGALGFTDVRHWVRSLPATAMRPPRDSRR
jgi:hypothetical protein